MGDVQSGASDSSPGARRGLTARRRAAPADAAPRDDPHTLRRCFRTRQRRDRGASDAGARARRRARRVRPVRDQRGDGRGRSRSASPCGWRGCSPRRLVAAIPEIRLRYSATKPSSSAAPPSSPRERRLRRSLSRAPVAGLDGLVFSRPAIGQTRGRAPFRQALLPVVRRWIIEGSVSHVRARNWQAACCSHRVV